MNFFQTVSAFHKNTYVNPYGATLRHVGWQFRKLFNCFPCDLKFRGFVVRVADRSIANGCGALLNAMGYYDPNNMLFIEEIFKQGRCQTFFDVGANIGVYSLIAAAQSRASRVFAFEPHPYTFSLLEDNVRLNRLQNQISGYQRALSDQDGTALFSIGLAVPRIEWSKVRRVP